jgi:hypothetical protein
VPAGHTPELPLGVVRRQQFLSAVVGGVTVSDDHGTSFTPGSPAVIMLLTGIFNFMLGVAGLLGLWLRNWVMLLVVELLFVSCHNLRRRRRLEGAGCNSSLAVWWWGAVWWGAVVAAAHASSPWWPCRACRAQVLVTVFVIGGCMLAFCLAMDWRSPIAEAIRRGWTPAERKGVRYALNKEEPPWCETVPESDVGSPTTTCRDLRTTLLEAARHAGRAGRTAADICPFPPHGACYVKARSSHAFRRLLRAAALTATPLPAGVLTRCASCCACLRACLRAPSSQRSWPTAR